MLLGTAHYKVQCHKTSIKIVQTTYHPCHLKATLHLGKAQLCNSGLVCFTPSLVSSFSEKGLLTVCHAGICEGQQSIELCMAQMTTTVGWVNKLR